MSEQTNTEHSVSRPKPYTVREHYSRRDGVRTYTVAIKGSRDVAGGVEFYVREDAERFADQRNRIEGRRS